MYLYKVSPPWASPVGSFLWVHSVSSAKTTNFFSRLAGDKQGKVAGALLCKIQTFTCSPRISDPHYSLLFLGWVGQRNLGFSLPFTALPPSFSPHPLRDADWSNGHKSSPTTPLPPSPMPLAMWLCSSCHWRVRISSPTPWIQTGLCDLLWPRVWVAVCRYRS